MKIFVTGTRGIPDIPGGVEKHCQELYPLIASKGHEIHLCTRSPYVTHKIDKWHGISLINSFAPRIKSLEAIVHTFIAILQARFCAPDIVHIHAIGPSLLTPLARLMGLKIVVTNHGPDYKRQKWGKLAGFVLRFGEKMGGVFANEVIVISSAIADIVKKRCHREANLIYNGVAIPQKCSKTDYLSQIDVKPRNYLLAVARFVPEKGLHDLIDVFRALEGGHKLVIAGDTDHETRYSRNLRKMAADDNRIILTGYITGEPLNQLYSHARLFVLPSYHEGLPIALLEAMSYGLPVLVSNIPANLEVGLPAERYFQCGNTSDLQKKIEMLLDKGLTETEQRDLRLQIGEKYDWLRVAEQTIGVYKRVIGNEKERGISKRAL